MTWWSQAVLIGLCRRPGGVRLVALLPLLLVAGAAAQQPQITIAGRLSAWGVLTDGADQAGLRYLPELSLSTPLTGALMVDANVSYNLTTVRSTGSGNNNAADIDPYRFWGRLANDQSELRVGLQKINFGAATLLRPLRWFDSLDPRDPLQLTDGVRAVLARHYFLNNANIWLWGLHDNDRPKGWELQPTAKHSVEWGGRLAGPVAGGDMGISYHHREVDPESWPALDATVSRDNFSEQRIGLDGKWDLGIGLWFETTLTWRPQRFNALRYDSAAMLGADYSFAIGNGPLVTVEHMESGVGDQPYSTGGGQSVSALSLSYPLSLLDSLAGYVYYDWDSRDWSRYISWQRLYDNWQIDLAFFANPEPRADAFDNFVDGVVVTNSRPNELGNKGIQLIISFNH